MIKRIVSGGQTGVDRAALDAAQALGIKTGGWVPRNRWAEDGRVPDRYLNMKETTSADPAARTECNVRDSDGTVVFSHGAVSGGTELTVQAGGKLRKPMLRLDLATQPAETAARRLLAWSVGERYRSAQRRRSARERGRRHLRGGPLGAGIRIWRNARCFGSE